MFIDTHAHIFMTVTERGISLEDIISFASENGIRSPKAIIRKVASAVSSFRTLAQRNGVSPQWIGRVESTIIGHLKAWGEWKEEAKTDEITINGHTVSNFRLEQAYKGNYHLYATIDGNERKFVIGKNKEAFAMIEQTGIDNLTLEYNKARQTSITQEITEIVSAANAV